MKLADFFAAIAPYFEGRIGYAEAASALFPENPENAEGRVQRDRERLAIYGRFCERHRFEALESTFSETRAAVIRGAGEPAWSAIVGDYFRAWPMRHAELNENGSELPAFLAKEHEERGLPLFIAELADLEWWDFRTRTAPDDPLDAVPDSGPLRIGATVELRPYQHDLIGWLAAREEAAEAEDKPEAAACVAIFWRDRELDALHAGASPLELAILHALFEKRPLASAAGRAGASEKELAETVDDLCDAGIIRGLRGLREPA